MYNCVGSNIKKWALALLHFCTPFFFIDGSLTKKQAKI